ncbi:MAG TPA: serine/threonine-protein kinase [Bryobacteraceae bacterium]|nr:serine/threonine-protein kinase [Bryobacteraceae bacterium]
MTADRWRQIENLFEQALQRPGPEQGQFLNEVCGDDADLRRELASLLACDVPGEQLIDIPELAGIEEAMSDMTGRRIGPYRVTSLIGHGGMGAVYLGIRDDEQYQKQVAIKLLKRGMDTQFMLNRFKQERQILANLEHPFIARLLDGGATDDGLPYLVMEYVDGVPITKYCEERNLTVLERLRLFRLVCEAVQYAHQNLVVHRDLKPSNILTTKEGAPKLLDFGIAKVVAPGLSSSATLTRREMRMLTPDYASPEQVRGQQISTASDTYSLGAVLYELLCCQRPHRFQSDSITDIERTICEIEPEKPSLAAARNQGSTPTSLKQLRRQLHGDLDNIVLTAMRKEPQRRYASAAEFSEDLRRYMGGLPVIAHEDSWSYRASKFIRRNRLAAGAAALLALTLVGGFVSTTVQARRAERRFQLVRGLGRSMLFDLYDQMEHLPGSTPLRASTVRTVVRYLDDLARDGAQDPDLEVEIAKAYERAGSLEGHPYGPNLGNAAAALLNYRKAVAIFERLQDRPGFRGEALRGLIDTNLRIGQLEGLMGNPSLAVQHSRKAAAIANEAFGAGGLELPPSTQMNLYYRLADAEYEHGSASGELSFCRKALEVCQKWIASNPNRAIAACEVETRRHMGSALGRAGDLAGSLDSFSKGKQTALQLSERAELKPEVRYGGISLLNSMGDVLAAPDDPNFGDIAGAIEVYKLALDLATRLEAGDTKNFYARRNVATCYWRLGMVHAAYKPAEALDYYNKSLQIIDELNTRDPKNAEYRYHASRVYMGLGESLHHLGRHEEAVTNLNRAVDLQRAILAVSPERIWNLRVLSRTYIFIGHAHLKLGNHPAAQTSFSEALHTAELMLRRAPTSLSHQLDLADALEALGEFSLAIARSPNLSPARRFELKREARAHLRKSLAIWQDWTFRKLAAPYAGRREAKVSQALAALGPV